MADGQVYDIPEGGLEWLRDKVAQLSRKIEKLGGEPIYLTVVGFHYDTDHAADRKQGGTKRKIWEVFLAVPEIKLAGWEFVGRIDHTRDSGNILRKMISEDLPQRFRDCAPGCDHCRTNRRRRDTFVVRHTESQEYQQVGTSCLKDFLGHEDAGRLAKIAELVSNLENMVRYTRGGTSWAERDYMDVELFLDYVAHAIQRNGWTSIAAAKEKGETATWFRAMGYIAMGMDQVDESAKKLASDALAWARSLGPDDSLNDYQHNIKVIANSECIEHRHLGIAASIVGSFYVNSHKSAPQMASTFQDSPGAKISRFVKLVKVQQLDSSTRHRFMDREGNVYTWFASNVSLRDKVDTCFRISAKVKAHNEFRGEKQTIISHVQVS